MLPERSHMYCLCGALSAANAQYTRVVLCVWVYLARLLTLRTSVLVLLVLLLSRIIGYAIKPIYSARSPRLLVHHGVLRVRALCAVQEC